MDFTEKLIMTHDAIKSLFKMLKMGQWYTALNTAKLLNITSSLKLTLNKFRAQTSAEGLAKLSTTKHVQTNMLMQTVLCNVL